MIKRDVPGMMLYAKANLIQRARALSLEGGVSINSKVHHHRKGRLMEEVVLILGRQRKILKSFSGNSRNYLTNTHKVSRILNTKVASAKVQADSGFPKTRRSLSMAYL